MESELRNEKIRIAITILDKELYLISGEDNDGKFSVERKFKDLVHLRRILQKRWPGCSVPYFPKSIVT